jgi:hypothetical protein
VDDLYGVEFDSMIIIRFAETKSIKKKNVLQHETKDENERKQPLDSCASQDDITGLKQYISIACRFAL